MWPNRSIKVFVYVLERETFKLFFNHLKRILAKLDRISRFVARSRIAGSESRVGIALKKSARFLVAAACVELVKLNNVQKKRKMLQK